MKLLAILLALLCAGPALAAPPPGGTGATALSYSGPCDAVSCAEGWSVAYGLSSSYNGNLFRIAVISSPSTVEDIGQTAAHTANLSGVQSFCGGSYSGCAISIIYAQVQGSSNNLVPSVFNAPNGPNCSAGGLTCACVLTIDSATGLPIIPLNQNPAHCEYTLTSDGTATGITGGSSTSVSAAMAGQTVQTAAMCCGAFLISHAYNAADTPGTDFGLNFQYSNTGSFVNCPSAGVSCLFPDLESNTTPVGISLGSAQSYVFGFLSWNESANTISGSVDNRASWTATTPPSSMNPGTHVHMGGGGDLSQPAPFNFFEGYFFNSALTATQQTALFNSVTQRYPAASFP